MEKVVLVTKADEEKGEMEKILAHKSGLLHRAFSILLFNDDGEQLLQKRALSKYHSGGLWTNSCCGHPRPGENSADAAERRLFEELGIRADLEWKFSFHYETKLENGMFENEIDHVFYGTSNLLPQPNPEEASECRFISEMQLAQEMEDDKDRFTLWFQIIHERIK
jgi:isopentenyl-diphosphate Delta-isomerase